LSRHLYIHIHSQFSEFLRTEIAVVKEKYLELKGEELNPLIDAIRDIQVEASEQDLHLKETTCDLRFRPVHVVIV
jgi:hypothetical protein